MNTQLPDAEWSTDIGRDDGAKMVGTQYPAKGVKM